MQFGIMMRMKSMLSYSKNDVILVRYPFSDLSSSKVRPAVVVSAPHIS
jgi:mRNA interferase MazF